jgi:AhpC/TSA family
MKFVPFRWLLAIMILSGTPAWAMERARVVTAGDFFPEFSFPMVQAKSDVEYLGLPTKFFGLVRGETFSLQDVKADLIFLEFMNKYCFSCQLQAPVLGQVFSMVDKDPQLKGRIKFIGIGVGNNEKEVESFKAEKQIPFPFLADPKFLVYESIGEPGVAPLSLHLRKTAAGLLVTYLKAGLTKAPDRILKDLTHSLTADVDVLLKEFKDPSFQHFRAPEMRLGLSEQQLLKKAQECMSSPQWKLLHIAKVASPDERGIYVAEAQAGKKKFYLFARLVSRAPICDICHAVHFLYAFDQKGMILNFLPLEVTKEDNLPWNAQEVARMRSRLVGRSILHPVDFDAKLDSISSATMTSILIVDAINKARRHYEGLKRMGYIP